MGNGEFIEANQSTQFDPDIITLKALSLRQPYANLVVNHQKTIETRKWTTRYRGDILICASKFGKIDPRGFALCLVELCDIRPMTNNDEEAACIGLYPGANAWILDNLRVLENPFRVTGRLGLFDITIDKELLQFEST